MGVRRWGSVVRLRPETRLGSRGRCGAVASVRARDAGTLPPNRWDTSRSQAEPMRRWASEKADHIVCQVPPTSSYDGDCGTARAALIRILGPVRATDVGPPFRPLDGPLGFLLHSLSDCLPKRPCACCGRNTIDCGAAQFRSCVPRVPLMLPRRSLLARSSRCGESACRLPEWRFVAPRRWRIPLTDQHSSIRLC